MRLHAVILAGGQARRMGGIDKGLCLLGEKTILSHVIGRLEGQAGPIALNANHMAAGLAATGLPVLPDPVPGRPGPLAGILAAMLWAGRAGAERVLTVPCDTPFLPRDLVAALAGSSRAEGVPVIVAGAYGLHPAIALWPTALAGRLAADLEAGTRRLGDWALAQNARILRADWPEEAFFNINTPDDLARARALLG